MSFGAYAEDAVPTQIHVLGAGASTINGQPGTWDEKNPINVDVVDGTAVINIQNAVGAYQIYTCSVEEGVAGGWGPDSPLNTSRIGAATTKIADFGVLQDITKGANTLFNENSNNKPNGNVTIIFSENLTKVTVLPTTLFCIGGVVDKDTPISTINGTNLAGSFDKAIAIEAAEGYFTIPVDWTGSIFISPWTDGSVWGKGVIGEGAYVVNANNAAYATVQADKLNQEHPVIFNNLYVFPPFVSESLYTIKISQDLKKISYEVAHRTVQIEIRQGLYGDAETHDMETTDGVNYTYTVDETLQDSKVFTFINKDKYTDTAWRRNGTIAFNQEEGWYTKAGATPSSTDGPFVGTIKFVMPNTMVSLSTGWGNKYWSNDANAKATFIPDIQTGGIGGVDVKAAEVEYFNLQGVRVDNPQNGIFIRRQGAKVSKVIVK